MCARFRSIILQHLCSHRACRTPDLAIVLFIVLVLFFWTMAATFPSSMASPHYPKLNDWWTLQRDKYNINQSSSVCIF